MSSHNRGKCKTISNGSASAAKIISSLCPLLRVLVASFAPFLIFLRLAADCIISRICFCKGFGASGNALDLLLLSSYDK